MSKRYIFFCIVSLFFQTFLLKPSERYGDEWRKKVFSYVYDKKHWGDGESVSGPGSSLKTTSVIREMLPAIIRAIGAQTVLDAGCGDFNWMKELQLDLELFIGVDIVPDLIEKNKQKYETSKYQFFCLDIVKDSLPPVDVILCRDCLAHLSYKDISEAIHNFKKSGATYLLVSDFPQMKKNNTDIPTGDFRPVNFRAAPYNFPEPLMTFVELSAEGNMKRWGKHLSLWLLKDIPAHR